MLAATKREARTRVLPLVEIRIRPLWQGCAVIRKHFLTYLALSTVGVSQPLLDLYGKNATVFSTAKLSPFEVALFLLVVALGPAFGAIALDRATKFLGPKVNESMRLLLIGGFSFLAGLAIARWAHLSGDVPTLALASVVALLVPYFFDKKKWAREWSRWLAVLSVAVLGSAVLQLQPILLQQQGPKSDAVIGNKDVSVLQIVLDEFALAPPRIDTCPSIVKTPGLCPTACSRFEKPLLAMSSGRSTSIEILTCSMFFSKRAALTTTPFSSLIFIFKLSLGRSCAKKFGTKKNKKSIVIITECIAVGSV